MRGAWMLVAIVTSACSSNRSNPTTIRDTTGAQFRWSCNDTCTVSALTTPAPSDCGSGVYYDYSDLRFVFVCPVTPGTTQSPPQFIDALCRPLACNTSAECPQFVERAFACVKGLCQWDGASGALTSAREALSLCLSDVPRPSTCAAAATDPLTLAAQSKVQCSDDGGTFSPDASGYSILEHCAVPADCRQP